MKPPLKHVPGPDRRNRWGRFEDGGRTYVVTEPDTPRPINNYVTAPTHGAFFSQCGWGLLFYRAYQYLPVTAWHENEYTPSFFRQGRFVYLRDRDRGDCWLATPQPGRPKPADFWCRHSPGHSVLHATQNGVEMTFRFHVDLRDPVEVWSVTLRNVGRSRRRLRVVPAVEFSVKHIALYAGGRYLDKLGAVHVIDPRANDATQPMDNGGFIACDLRVGGYDVSRAEFLGPGGDWHRPRAVLTGRPSSRPSATEAMVGALHADLTLAPGAERTFHVFVGFAQKANDVAAILRRVRRPGAADRSFAAVERDWADRCAPVRVRTPDANVNRWVNHWGKVAVTNHGRFINGARLGVRDVIQSMRSVAIFDPAVAREKILWVLGYLRPDGQITKLIDQFGRGRHDPRTFADSPAWIPETVSAYVRWTGDAALLDEVVPYSDGSAGTVWEHLRRIVERLYPRRGWRNMLLTGAGDWNDALGGGEKGKSVSVWLATLLHRALRHMAELADFRGQRRLADKYRDWCAELTRSVNRAAWDGDWYVYSFNDEGEPVGSKRNPEGRIVANVQSWALMEGMVPPARKKKLWRAFDRYLVTDAGVLVLHPEYRDFNPGSGYIQLIHPGAHENAAAYCHGSAFAVGAYLADRRGGDAVEMLNRTLPTNPKNPRADAEPFGISNFYFGPAHPKFGATRYSWCTGTSTWLLWQAVEGIVGLRPGFDGLRIDPCVPPTWKRFEADVRWRGADWHVVVRNPAGVESGVASMTLDGEPVAGNFVPLAAVGRAKKHEIVVVLGKAKG